MNWRDRCVALGARGLEVPTAGLREESFEYLRSGGKPLRTLPVLIQFYSDGKRAINDGRHRILLARERGDESVPGSMIGYGPRGGVLWRFTGRVPI
jgi:hypothetical protein